MPGFQLPAVGDKPLQSQWLQEQLCCSSQFWGLVRVCSAGFMQAHLRGGGGCCPQLEGLVGWEVQGGLIAVSAGWCWLSERRLHSPPPPGWEV